MSYIEQKTEAFNRFVNQKFINHFKDYMDYSYNVKDEDAEIALQTAMCRYYNNKIQEKFDFKHIKKEYDKNISCLSPNLDVIQKKTKY